MKSRLLKILSISSVISVMAISGCDREEYKLTPQDSSDISEETVVDSYFQDVDDLAGIVLQSPSDDQYTGGRTSATITISDNRFACEGIDVTIEPGIGSSPENPAGVITVDFGAAGCADLKGNVRKGKLIFTYNGKRFAPGSTLVTTTDNYFINGIRLQGTRTTTNITGSSLAAPKYNVVLENGQATFEDSSIATRESDITVSWVRGASPVQDMLIVHTNSTASGITRAGRFYEVSLTKQLEYQRFCPMAVSGIKKYLIDSSKEITIDYGAGSCDKTIMVTINGVTRTISVG